MKQKITKKTRDEAIQIAAIWASTPSGWDDDSWSPEAQRLYRAAFATTYGGDGEYRGEYDVEAHETAAEVECRLREGWSP